jgi:uncharacterized membrane protein
MESKRSTIMRWLEQGLIAQDNAEQALSVAGVLPDAQRWQHFLERLLLWLGALALAFSLMFFIAYNWDAMGRYAKFALIEVAIVAGLAGYWKLGGELLAAKVILVVCSLLVGVLLAFYGQTYQTGADPWQLFFNWSLLILPWVVVARFAALWVLWLGLLNLSMVLYFQAMGGLFWILFASTENLLWAAFVLNSLAWLVWEKAALHIQWLAERWALRLLALASGSAITWLNVFAIFDKSSTLYVSIPVYLLWMGSILYVYKARIKDLFMLAGFCLSGIIVVTSAAARMLSFDDDAGTFFILTLLVMGMTAGAAVWLRQVYQEQQA